MEGESRLPVLSFIGSREWCSASAREPALCFVLRALSELMMFWVLRVLAEHEENIILIIL